MKIKKLHLYTNQLESEKTFYCETLGFELIEEREDSFTVKVGWSELSFSKSETSHLYHYCFLIPSNQLLEALEWMEKRIDVISDADGRKTHRFENWNADSFYFHDASGNIAEFIVRYDLNNKSDSPFDVSHVLSVNEIGMPTTDVKEMNNWLETHLKTQFWKGDLDRFGTNGSQEALFLIPNYLIKDEWFPTRQKIVPEPFDITIANSGIAYDLRYENGNLQIDTNPNINK